MLHCHPNPPRINDAIVCLAVVRRVERVCATINDGFDIGLRDAVRLHVLLSELRIGEPPAGASRRLS